MDRVIVYTDALGESDDILNTNKFAMTALAYMAHGVLGETGPYVEGLEITPTSPTPDLHVHIDVGSIYVNTEVDAAAYGDLGTDTSSLVKQGINAAPVTLTIAPPSTGGFSQVFLVQVAYNDVDDGSLTLSYFNAGNVDTPFSGPAGSGISQYTIRRGKCVVALKAGIAATTGTQTTPSPDAGYVGLYTITVANGATQVTSGNIATLDTIPTFPTLPEVPPGVQNEVWTYAIDTSTGGVPIATNGTTGTGSAVLNFASVPAYVTTGMKVYDLTATTAITGGQTVLSKTGSTVTMSANANATVGNGDLIAFSSNAIVAKILPPPASLVPGLKVAIKLTSTSTGATTLNLNGFGGHAVTRSTGAAIAPGDLPAGMIAEMTYDGSNFQVTNFTGGSAAVSVATVKIPYAVDTGTVNHIIASFTPAIASVAAGDPIEVKILNTVSGPTDITINALSALPVKDRFLANLTQAGLVKNQVALMIFDGTNFQVVGDVTPAFTGDTTFYVNNSTGNDSNNGLTSGTPWLTVAHALTAIAAYDLRGFTATLQFATTGINYQMPTTLTFPSSGILVLNGDTATQSAITLVGTSSHSTVGVGTHPGAGPGGVGGNGANVTVQGFTINCATSGNVACIGASRNAHVMANHCTLTTTGSGVTALVMALSGALVELTDGMIYTGNAGAAWLASEGSQIAMEANGATSGTPHFSIAFVWVKLQSTCELDFGSWTWSGSGATGARYNVAFNSVINTGGSGARFFPGSQPGVESSSGFYL